MSKITSNKFNLENYNFLDDQDPLKEFSKRFHFPKYKTKTPFIYLSGNSLGLQSENTQKYVLEELNAWKCLGVDGHLISKRPWFAYHEFLTSYSAEIVNNGRNNSSLLTTVAVRIKSKKRPKSIEKIADHT